MEHLTSLVRRCVEDYDMIQDGERIAVGISGGKDSLSLLCSLASLRRYYPKRFSLAAITIGIGFDDMDFSGVRELCRRLDVEYIYVPSDIRHVVFDVKQEKNPCSLCVKMRKGLLNDTLMANGISKVAFGHHMDDAVETYLMSLIYEGRISCFRPVTFMDRSGVTQIRPMLYADEAMTTSLARRYALPVVKNTCPMDGVSKRQDVKELIEKLSLEQKDFKQKVFRAIQRFPMPGWEVIGNGGRK
ncbi:MAG: tRNA 2-thiocytidine biosynthesis TtcA family protein [Clostridiales bacterium]|nr:tRNA 2-thiocytidine biosynthesis TtcA family protein [Clostridiales bacterium]